MAASSRGASAVRGLLRTSTPSSPRLCRQCARSESSLFRSSTLLSTPATSRLYSGPAAASTTTNAGTPIIDHPPSSVPLEPTPSPQSLKAHYTLRSGVILTRAPLLTATSTPFEDAFYFYQKRLNERLCMPFVTSVYYKPDTPSLIDWNLKVADRAGTPGKDIGTYHGKSSRSWDDELAVGDDLSKPEHTYRSLLNDAVMRISDDAEVIPEEDRASIDKPQDRVTEADREGDVRRLDRALERTLHLVVKGKDGSWGFPNGTLGTEDTLHHAARSILDRTAGVNMNTWIVGRAPVAHHVVAPKYAADGALEERGEKTFFLKGRIMAGQANLEGNPYGYTDFKWLTREELQAELDPEYFRCVRNMMADR